jgi:hypothetical protein
MTGAILLHPEIGAERLEALGGTQFSGTLISRLAAEMAAILAETPGIGPADFRRALERAGHGTAIASVLEKLRRSGHAGLENAGAERAAATWDDAAHLRLRAGTLSIERQAAAAALGRETGEVELHRLRDIQEQDQRNLHPLDDHAGEEAVIVHPFKRL